MPALLRAVRADITTLAVDAIVKAANASLLGGCKTGDARLTKGYRLPARFVIHTVGPVWHGGIQGEAELLASCYRSSLELAAANGIQTVAFPSISTGVYGYPIERAASVAVSTVRAVVPKLAALREVAFCCFSQGDLRVYERLLALMEHS